MVNDVDMFETSPSDDKFGVQLLRWICPRCGTIVDTKITQRDFDRLSVEELQKIMDNLTTKKMVNGHKCKMIPIQFVERGMNFNGIYRIGRGDGDN